MIPGFTLERASKNGAIFDEEELCWLNAVYIRNCKTEDLIERLKPFLKETGLNEGIIDLEWFNKVIDLVIDELTTLSEADSHINIFFDDKYEL